MPLNDPSWVTDDNPQKQNRFNTHGTLNEAFCHISLTNAFIGSIQCDKDLF